MDKPGHWFAELSWAEAGQARERAAKTVLLFPVGTTEAHGPHSPLATDLIISIGMCKRAIAALEGNELQAYILPPLGYGVTRFAGEFPGTIHISEGTLRVLLVDICSSLIGQGWPHILLVNNHFEPDHIRTLYESIEEVRRTQGVQVGYLDLTRKERARRLTEEFWRGECHAGQYETSLVLAERPELVDTDRMAALTEVPVNLPQVIGQGLNRFLAMGMPQAYTGTPARATAEEGDAVFDVLTGMLLEAMRALVEAGTGGCDEPGFYSRVHGTTSAKAEG